MCGHFGQESNASGKKFSYHNRSANKNYLVIISNLRPKSYIEKLWTVHAFSNQFKILGMWNIQSR